MTGGWWRRNRWGVIGLVPALAVAVALPVHDAYGPMWNARPRTPVAVGADGWARYAGAEMRVSAIVPARLKDYGGAAVATPPGLAAWHTTVEFKGKLAACDVLLEDSDGDTYDANPSELTDLGADVPFAACGTDGRADTVVDLYFVTPAGVTPVAVRVVVRADLPRYARLTSR